MTTRKLPLLLSIVVLGIGSVAVAQSPKSDQSLVRDSMSGSELYRMYCAGCHGLDGRGKGPIAPALKTQPADLTLLALKNNGQFPLMKVSQTIQGDDAVLAHGPREMPVYGDFFRGFHSDEPFVKLRVKLLTEYVASIQKK